MSIIGASSWKLVPRLTRNVAYTAFGVHRNAPLVVPSPTVHVLRRLHSTQTVEGKKMTIDEINHQLVELAERRCTRQEVDKVANYMRAHEIRPTGFTCGVLMKIYRECVIEDRVILTVSVLGHTIFVGRCMNLWICFGFERYNLVFSAPVGSHRSRLVFYTTRFFRR